ncbi:c-type cytochrome [Roseisalinus antarcticus]|nr:cytochrome c [Roseisalinus antarcticus]
MGVAAPAFAESHVDPAIAGAIAARQAHMQLYAHNLGIVGGMAQGEIEYDAEMATTAAADLVALSQISEQAYWPEGSDNSTGMTRALPAIWESPEGFAEHRADLIENAMALEAVAGDGVEALGGALRGIGGTCGACHREYRARDN